MWAPSAGAYALLVLEFECYRLVLCRLGCSSFVDEAKFLSYIRSEICCPTSKCTFRSTLAETLEKNYGTRHLKCKVAGMWDAGTRYENDLIAGSICRPWVLDALSIHNGKQQQCGFRRAAPTCAQLHCHRLAFDFDLGALTHTVSPHRDRQSPP